MTQEEKAKSYDEALKKMKAWVRGEHPECFTEAQKAAEFIFPELKESEDERIRKAIMEFFELQDDNTTYSFIPKKDILTWLEKQGKHLENYDEAEKEKADFVGDGFVKCHADFLDFKEGNTYWLEYIGDDKYNVRSDNLLGKTYHITPGQLYTVFKKSTWIGKRGGKKSKKVSIWKHWKDGIAGNAEGKQIYLTKIGNTYNLSSCLSFECDYIELSDLDNLMSKGQCEPNPYSGVSFKYNGHTFGMCARDGGAEVLMDGNLKAFISSDKSFIFPQPTLTPKSALEAAKEEKNDNYQNWVIPTSNPDPKFHEGEWVVYNHDICQIVKREEGCNKLVTVFGIEKELVNERNLSTAHLWTIQDAKDGDVLAYVTDEEDLWLMIYWSLYEPYEGHVHYHALLVNNEFSDKGTCCICIDDLHPATKEQRDLLFSKMKEAGYEWYADKKELKKIDARKNLALDRDLIEADCMIIHQKPTWTEEDEHRIKDTIYFLNAAENAAEKYYASTVELDACIDWLKSLKERIGG